MSKCEEVKNKVLSEVNILHISDLHYGIDDGDKATRQKRIVKSLISTLKNDNKVPVEWKPDIIAITGDIAWSGNEAEYDIYIQEFLKPIVEAIDGLTEDRVITCPGNHDIIRAKAQGYERPHSADSIEISKITRESIQERRGEHFAGYVQKLCNNNPQKLCYEIKFEEWPWLRFLVLNSAWDSRKDSDEGKLRVGLELLEELIGESDNEEEIRVALFHHPNSIISDCICDEKGIRRVERNWLHPSERFPQNDDGTCFSLFLENNVDFILNGHIHRKIRPLHSENGKAIKLICGTAYSNDTFQYHCRIIKLHPTKKPKYMELSSCLANANNQWSTTTPDDFEALYSYNRHQKSNSYDKLENAILSLKETIGQEKSNEVDKKNMLEYLAILMQHILPTIEFNNSYEEQLIKEQIIDYTLEQINRLKLEQKR